MRWHFPLMGGHSWSTGSCFQPFCLNDHINLINSYYINIVPVIAFRVINSDAIRMESKAHSTSVPPVLQSCCHFKSGINQMLIRREKVQAGAAANNPTRLRRSQWLIILQQRKCTSRGRWQYVSISSFNKGHCISLNIYFSNWKYLKHFATRDLPPLFSPSAQNNLKLEWPGQNEFVWVFLPVITYLYYHLIKLYY